MAVLDYFRGQSGNGSSNQSTKSSEVLEGEGDEEWHLSNETYLDLDLDDNPMANPGVRAMLIVLYSTVFVCCFIGNV